MKYASELFEKYCSDDNKNMMGTEVETIIKQETRKKEHKIDLDLFYEMIEFASEIPYDKEDEHLNISWEKAVNDYLKKFYPKEKPIKLN